MFGSEKPKAYWKLENGIKGSSRDVQTSQSDSDTLIRHIQHLHSSVDSTCQNMVSKLDNKKRRNKNSSMNWISKSQIKKFLVMPVN